MTRDEILRLEQGPELDRLVAERIMGWKEGPDFWVSFEGVVHLKAGEVSPGHVVYRGEPWSPSTDIAAAWEVVKVLREKKFVIDILGSLEDFIVKIWNENENEGLSIAKASAEQAPLAICRAALAAVEKEGGWRR